MNDNAKAWVAALRSGKYKQGRERLRREDDSFCCLGVACEMAVQAGVIEPPELVGVEYLQTGGSAILLKGEYLYSGLSGLLPTKVRDWLGLSSMAGTYGQAEPGGKQDGLGSLAEENDAGLSFEEIADTIEREPEGLFA